MGGWIDILSEMTQSTMDLTPQTTTRYGISAGWGQRLVLIPVQVATDSTGSWVTGTDAQVLEHFPTELEAQESLLEHVRRQAKEAQESRENLLAQERRIVARIVEIYKNYLNPAMPS